MTSAALGSSVGPTLLRGTGPNRNQIPQTMWQQHSANALRRIRWPDVFSWHWFEWMYVFQYKAKRSGRAGVA